MLEITMCPECGAPSDVQWRTVLGSTDGPVEHARILCARGHGFFMPTRTLASTADAPDEPVRSDRVQTHKMPPPTAC
jgi:hypothetical protein